jgi:ornithine cyclodeaminase/alanine dehydrogenase-like protein (mu-crystallin family)
MPLYLTEKDVTGLLTMPEAMGAVEAAFRAQAAGDASNHARERFFLPRGVFHHMAAALPEKGVMGTKQYTSFPAGTRFWVLLFSSENGDLLSVMEADRLGQVRTGAATGVAARFMARQDAHTATLFGAGHQARTQAEAIVAARPGLRVVQVFSRDYARRERFCLEMTRKLNVRFVGLTSAEEAARGTDILVCATNAAEPVLKADWLSPGDFVAAVGANRLTAREIGEDVVERAERIAVDDLPQARTEAAELIFAHERRKLAWERVVPLADIVAGRVPGRTDATEVTLFKSLGVALEDVAVAHLVYEKARAQGVGREL